MSGSTYKFPFLWSWKILFFNMITTFQKRLLQSVRNFIQNLFYFFQFFHCKNYPLSFLSPRWKDQRTELWIKKINVAQLHSRLHKQTVRLTVMCSGLLSIPWVNFKFSSYIYTHKKWSFVVRDKLLNKKTSLFFNAVAEGFIWEILMFFSINKANS